MSVQKLRPGNHAARPRRKRLRTQSSRPGRRRREIAPNPDFSSPRRNERSAHRPAPRASHPAMLWTGLVHVRARSRRISRCFILPHGIPARARAHFQLKPRDAFNAASGPRSTGQFRHGGTFFFPGSLSLSLAAPPAGPPLRGQGAFGSSLKGIPPTVPSSRPAPPPFDERAIPLLKIKKKELYAL